MNRCWALAAVVLAALGGAASTRFPGLTVAAFAGLVVVLAATRNRPAATAVLLPLCLLPYAVPIGGLLLGPSDALLLVVAGLLLLDWALGHEPGSLLGPLALPAVAFVTWTAMSAAWAADPRAVLVETAQRAAFVLGGIAVVRNLPADGRAVRAGLVGLVAGAAALGSATVVTGALQGTWLHVYALGMHKNWLGFVLSFGFVVLVALRVHGELAAPSLWVTAGVAITLGLAMSGSRGGWIGALAGAVMIVVLHRPGLAWPALSLVAVATVLLLVVAPAATTERIDVSTPDTSAGMRLRTWSSGVEAIREEPVLGHGAGNFRAVVKNRGTQVDPNNLMLLAWAETGVFGLVILVWLVAAAARLAVGIGAVATGTPSLANAAGAAIATAALAHAQVDMFWNRGIALATFMAFGLVAWSHRRCRVDGHHRAYPPAVVTAP
ncbi:MAG: O-antigen ligase family protein [Acidimicrobiales bacterium]